MKVRGFFFGLIILSTVSARAQYTSNLQRFQVQEIKGCAPFTLQITSTGNALLIPPVNPCTGATPCQMEWGDGTANQQNIFTHTYTQPGNYKLRILFQTIGYDEIDLIVTPNTQPVFDVYTCGGREVQVRVTDTSYDSYIINYNDASAEVTVPKGSLAVDNHIYATTGSKTISVRGKNVNAADNCTPPATKLVNAVNALTAPFVDQLTVTSSTQIGLDFNNGLYSDNVQYRVEIGVNTNAGASFQTAQNLLNTSTSTVASLRTDDNFYCFRIGAFDPCNSTIQQSNIICSVNLDGSAQNNSNQLTWTTSATGVNNFTVARDGNTLGSTGGLVYNDNAVVCKTLYAYQLFTNYSNGSQSTSLLVPITALSTDVPTAIQNITAVVNNGTVDLTWQQDPAFQPVEYEVYRRSGANGFGLLTTTSVTQLTDNDYTTTEEYCYRIDYTDVCDNDSPDGAEVCPIRLQGAVDSGNIINLSWNDYTGWNAGVNAYLVEVYNDQGVLLQTTNNGTSTVFTYALNDPDNQVYSFIVRANANSGGLGQAVSNELELAKKTIVIYPKAFTPNGDNTNDIFKPIVPTDFKFVTKFEMKIFNRWGELLFSTNDYDIGWDGKFKGAPQPEGTYAYVSKITDLTGQTFDRSGSFVLLRRN